VIDACNLPLCNKEEIDDTFIRFENRLKSQNHLLISVYWRNLVALKIGLIAKE